MKKKKTVKFKESLGIDIGSHSVKMVHLKRIHNGFKLLNYEIRPTVPQGIEYILSDLRNDRFGPVISEMLKTLKLKPRKMKHVVSSIGGDDISIKQIKTIFLPDEELESALFFEAKKHIPISGNEMVLDYQVLNIEENTNNMNILLAASTKDMVQTHTNILGQAGLVANMVDVDPLAVANSFALNTMVEDGVYIILNIGAHRTNLVIFGPKSKYFARDINLGGMNFTKDIMRKKDIAFDEAEEYKFENGIGSGDSDEDTQSISLLDISEKSTHEQIVEEVRRSLRYYVKDAGNSDYRKIILMGGSAKLKGLPEYIESKVNIPTEVFDPFVGLEMPEKLKDKQDPQLSLAIGLAMRAE